MDEIPIAQALRLIRSHLGFTQSVATRNAGAPDFRTLSHWETGRKVPSLKLLYRYLLSLGLDFSDLQDALDLARGERSKRRRPRFGMTQRPGQRQRRLLEVRADALPVRN